MSLNMHPIRVLLLLLPLIAIQARAKSCIDQVRGVDDFMIKTFQERDVFLGKIIEKYNEQKNKGGNGFNFTEHFPNEPYKLDRMRQRALDFYWHGDASDMQQRYRDMEFLALLDGMQMLEKMASSRLEPFQDKSDKAKKLESDVNELWQEWGRNQAGQTRRDGCVDAVQVMESDFKDFQENPSRFRNEFLSANIRKMKNNAAKYKKQSAKLMKQLNRDSYNPLYHLKDALNMISHIKYYDWAERFFSEYLEWIDRGQRPAPDSNCASLKSIPVYRLLMKAGEQAKKGIMLGHVVLVQRAQLKKENLGQDVDLNEIKEDLGGSSSSLKPFLQQRIEGFSEIETDNIYERYQMAKQLAQYEALIDFYPKVLPRLDGYYNQPNGDYFTTPSAIDPVPIERSLSEIDQEFERVARERNRGCEHWSAVLEADLKASKANPSGPETANVRETFQILKKTALDMKTRVSKLYDEVPRDHSRYLRPGTELALIEAEKKYQRLADLF